ncbi:MAG: hypothetical protein ACK4OP_17770 [Gemmobacter sp.]
MRLSPSSRTLARRAPAIGGFLAGIALPLVLAGVLLAALGGGLSDSREPPPPVYTVD